MMLPHALHTRALLSAALCAAATASAHAGENQTARASNEPPPAAARVAKLTNIETSYPNWSPDGRRIVYQSNRSGNSEIYVMNADGTGVLRLTDHQAVDENPAWSPDGRRIAFRSYRDGNAEIYTMAPDGSGLRNLTNHPADDIHPYWSPDGSRIVFNSTRAPIDGKPVLTIFSMRSDGSDVRQISRDGFEETYAQLSPDASRIVLRRRLEEETPGWERNPGNSEIYVMNADGSNARRLTHHPGFDGWPSWSPDGAWIAYAAEGAGDFQVALIRPDGSGFTVLTNGPGSFTKPIFSPDGRSIICTRTLDGNVEIFLIELAAAPAAPPNSATPLALIERAAARMGGVAVLDQLPALTTGYHLLERSLGQEEWPRGAAASSVQVGKRLVQPHDPRERMQMRRHMSGGRVYDRAVDAGRWHRLVTGARLAATSVEHSLSA
ncbi:MAG TPA: hypothetical protein VEA16_11010, partial [Vicinamibacterales bacterium]|nr:hypothetical protein [Vicinamibacterales bacterium]